MTPFPFFFFCFFFFFSDRPTQNQKTHSTINEKKGGWPYFPDNAVPTSRVINKLTYYSTIAPFYHIRAK